jgi:hypothetical protein
VLTRLRAGVPNPYPRYHTVAFNPGYQTPDDASLASAWNITGPMVDGGLCNFKILDCNLDNPGVVFPDPRNPLDPASRPVACPAKPNATNATDGSNATLTNATLPPQPVLRVYYGTACLLWRPDNGYGCHWNNILQAFEGSACVRSTAPTQCMCRHLTDFASARVPKIETCSVQDMLSLKPGAWCAGRTPVFRLTSGACKRRYRHEAQVFVHRCHHAVRRQCVPCGALAHFAHAAC